MGPGPVFLCAVAEGGVFMRKQKEKDEPLWLMTVKLLAYLALFIGLGFIH
jgi:hypothetical protein